MMRRLQDCLSTAFTEADADLRLPAIFRIQRTCVDHAGAHCAPIRQPLLPLFPLAEPFRHTRTEGQKHIKNP